MEYVSVKCVKSFDTVNVHIEQGTSWVLVRASFTATNEGEVLLCNSYNKNLESCVTLELSERFFREHFVLIKRSL